MPLSGTAVGVADGADACTGASQARLSESEKSPSDTSSEPSEDDSNKRMSDLIF